MSETWKRWEGQVVNGHFPLLRYVGGSDHSAVFLTERGAGPSQKAAIKLVPADPQGAESQLRRWQRSAKLTHPHLIRMFEAGRCELEGTPLLYVVMDAAEEDLAQILPERSLTPAEVREMLPPVLDALAHIHGKGLVHGRLRPSNIMAVGDQVKVSSDTLRAAGEPVSAPGGMDGYDPPEAASGKLTPAADVWSLAIALVEVLTQRRPTWDPAEPAPPSLPQGVPEPFQEIARRCLRIDPQQRWTVAEIAARLQPAQPVSTRPKMPVSAIPGDKKKSTAWRYVLALTAAGVVALILMAGSKTRSSSPPAAPGDLQPQQAGPASSPLPEPSPAPREPKPSPATRAKTPSAGGTSEKLSPSAAGKGAVLQQVLPRVSPSARDTIEGKIKVRVRVEVDPSGNVTEATLESPGPSKYFARLALEAARGWKFTPPLVRGQAAASQWTLRFGFRRTDTEVVPEQTAP
jgi:TonB family protein